MKELSIEEKAKRYDEAIEIARQIHDADRVSGIELTTCEEIFPELTESEDERIRKELITYLKRRLHSGFNQEVRICNDGIAWLEKQGEHANFCNKIQIGDKVTRNRDGVLVNLSQLNRVAKPVEKQGEQKPSWSEEDKNMLNWVIGYLINKMLNTSITEERTACKNAIAWLEKLKDRQKLADKVEPKFRAGDWVVSNLDKKARQISEVHFDEYNSYYVVDGESVNLEEYDRLHHLWTIQDAKDGDVLYSLEHNILWIYMNKKQFHAAINLNCANFPSFGGNIVIPSDVQPATKEQCDLLFQKMKEAGYVWDAEKKELRKVGSSVPWSDEQTRRNLIGFIKQLGATEIPSSEYNRYIDFLEKLGEQKLAEWSDNDKRIIDGLISICDEAQDNIPKLTVKFTHIEALKNWLKSLKDRVQPKQEWSEDDKIIKSCIEMCLTDVGEQRFNDYNVTLRECLDWLKSFRPQKQ